MKCTFLNVTMDKTLCNLWGHKDQWGRISGQEELIIRWKVQTLKNNLNPRQPGRCAVVEKMQCFGNTGLGEIHPMRVCMGGLGEGRESKVVL